uniref:Uncharacterized protein n=1 Tax=Meloidogyne incognita TaxID=6306 RepID=A0A914NDU4_MELIC
MVITKRYNSVEQSTSIHLSSTNLADNEQQKNQQWVDYQLMHRTSPTNEHLLQQSTPPINYLTPQQYTPSPIQQQQPQIPQRGIMRPTSRQEAYATNEFSRELPRPQSTIPSMHSPRAQFQQMPPTFYQSSPQISLPKTASSRIEAPIIDRRSIIRRKVPGPLLLGLSALQIIIGIVTLLIGAFNASTYKCMIEPNIPVYLIISGILLIASGVARIFFWLSSDSLTTGRRRGNNSGGGSHVCEYLIEGSILFCIVVIVILGCFWVYGASRYMQNQRYMYEWHYCNPTVYWSAWWSVTLHLAFFALLFLAVIILLVYGALLG